MITYTYDSANTAGHDSLVALPSVVRYLAADNVTRVEATAALYVSANSRCIHIKQAVSLQARFCYTFRDGGTEVKAIFP
jgi:hypothetical protein